MAELLGVDTDHGVTLRLGGVDLLDGTPIFDIKPYIPFVDSQPQALAALSMARRRCCRCTGQQSARGGQRPAGALADAGCAD